MEPNHDERGQSQTYRLADHRNVFRVLSLCDYSRLPAFTLTLRGCFVVEWGTVMRPYKSTVAPPFDAATPVWHGLYYYGGHWREVRNDRGAVVKFNTSKAAQDQAKLIVEELKMEAVR
jgi:hypothetical protein